MALLERPGSKARNERGAVRADGLPAAATSFTIPQGVLKPGERYVFQVSLEDMQGSKVRNRSMSFSEPYAVSGAKR